MMTCNHVTQYQYTTFYKSTLSIENIESVSLINQFVFEFSIA